MEQSARGGVALGQDDDQHYDGDDKGGNGNRPCIHAAVISPTADSRSDAKAGPSSAIRRSPSSSTDARRPRWLQRASRRFYGGEGFEPSVRAMVLMLTENGRRA